MQKDYGLTANGYHGAMIPESLLRDFFQSASKPLIVIVGPTASGKTGFALSIASLTSEAGVHEPLLRGKNKVVEIINADSRQFFRGFDIGTAKIAKKEMNNIPHHLIDVLEPSEKPTIAWFKDEATRTIDAIHARGNLPILCGGSMLYVSSIIDGLVPLSPVHPELRKKLSEEYDADYGVHLHEKLSEIDPEGAANIPKENKHHLIRAMEIVIVTGKKSSAQKKRVQSPYDLLMFGMSIPKKELDARIESRTRHMFAAGWVEEVQALLKAGVSVDDPAMESVGYTAIARRLQAGKTSKVIKEDRELFSEINRRTRQYAKRQRTWWKKDLRIHWISGS